MTGGSPSRSWRLLRGVVRAALVLILVISALAAIGYRNARADPVVRRMTVKLPGWPAGAAPVRVALLSDIHIGSPATDATRLARVVAQVNSLHPDLVLIAGDFVAGAEATKATQAASLLAVPLSRLRTTLGVVAVLGNHDHWTDATAIRRVLGSAGITVLINDAAARGPLAILGIDDGFTGHADVRATLAAAAPLRGARIVLTHSPDTATQVPRGAAALILAGHTHCGQAVFPLIGPVVINSPKLGRPLYDPRFRCGAVRDGLMLIVVTGGIGASLPLRYNAPPDLWLLTLGP